jgi:NAD(P)H-nitrite reductase large subunit
MKRYVIIGTGAAGISAAEAIRSQDASGEIILITEERYGYYSRPGLAYLLTREVTEKSLYPFTKADFQRLNAQVVMARITRIEPAAHRIESDRGKVWTYDRLLIATGSAALPLKIPGMQLEGVLKLDNLDDVHHILKLAGRGRTAVVAGGGITALELLEGLVAHGVKTHYFLRGDRYWSNVLDAVESQIVEEQLQEDGVQIHRHSEIAEILGKGGRVVGVKTTDGKTLRCNLVGIAIGVRPRSELGQAANLKIERGIVVNHYLETSAADVFAAGDVAQVLDPLTDKYYLDTLWGLARKQGHAAGMSMAGRLTPFVRPAPFNVTRLAGITTTIIGMVGHGLDADVIGIARGDSETWRMLPDALTAQFDHKINRLRMMLGPKHILGAVVMGDQTISRPLEDLITHQIDITPIRQQLLAPDAPLAAIISQFVTSQ